MKRAIDAFMVETRGRGRFIEPSASGTSNPERFISGFLGRMGNMGRFIGTFPTDEELPLQAHLLNLQNGVAGPRTLLSIHDSHKLNSTKKKRSTDAGRSPDHCKGSSTEWHDHVFLCPKGFPSPLSSNC